MAIQSAALSAYPYLSLPFLRRDIECREHDNGVLYLRSRVPLGELAPHLPAVFRQRAAENPDRVWLAARTPDRTAWQTLTWGQAGQQVDAVTQWLLNLQKPGRSVMVLSGNSVEHGVLALAAMQARMPCVPVTPAYSLLAQDFGRLRALPLQDVRVVCVDAMPEHIPAVHWSSLLNTEPSAELQYSLAAITPDTVAKYLFTSGSTGVPKVVPVTQRMLCASMAMHAHTVAYDPDEPAVLLEWLPWSHVAGGTAIFNSVIDEGGTMYLDEGRPVPGEFDRTLHNLKDIAPTRFSSVPSGYAMLADALEADDDLAVRFFSRLKRLTSSGAKLPESIHHRLQALAVKHLGAQVPFVAGYGATETCAATMVVHWPEAQPGLVGLPQPGVDIKLLPLESDRLEIRVKAPSVMSGYVDQPELTRAAFDDEGYYCLGDAVSFVDRSQPEEGLMFAGRVAEEFKLLSGIYVRTGALRVEVINAAAPLVSDAVIAGADRACVSVLLWLNGHAVRQRFGEPAALSPGHHPELRAALCQALQQHNRQHSGSSMRITRALVLTEPPSLDAGEITDKGYVNQRAVLVRRATEVERLYAGEPDADVIQVAP